MAAVLPIKLQKLTSRNHPFISNSHCFLTIAELWQKATKMMKGILTKKLIDNASFKRIIVTFSYTKMKLLRDKSNIKIMIGH